jgi:hypothetical protein
MGRALWIPRKCREYGLTVVVVDGADDRGGDSFNPGGVVAHHTAGASYGDMPSLQVLIKGHSTLSGPLCNVGFSRSGIVYYIASGRANHAGAGGYRGLVGNSSVLGIEAENNGTQPWTSDQLRLYPVLAAALLDGIGRGSEWACGHKEWAPTRKPDPHTWNMGSFRTSTATALATHGVPPVQPVLPPQTRRPRVVGVCSTPTGLGYWEVGDDGGIFNYGDAHFFGSAGGAPLNKPVVGMIATPTGLGYWLIAADGGIFNYGDAIFVGSLGGIALAAPITAAARTPTGGGLVLVGADGGVFCLGDATYHGNVRDALIAAYPGG